jgi:cytoplasmic iron level regulating protein YaaA (DUF328/UPF0246 family)
MSRINEHKFELNKEEYLLTWYNKPRLTKNGIEQKVKPLLIEYIKSKNLPIQIVNSKGNDEVPYTLARKILEHFSNNTSKIKKTISKSIIKEAKPTLNNTSIDFTNSKDSISNTNKDKLYLIPCSSSKISKKELENKKFKFENLEFDDKLGQYRKELIGKLKKVKSHKRKLITGEVLDIYNNFDFDLTAQAHRLYSKGKLYNSNSSDSLNWSQKEKEKIYIISALFGIIRADNYIPLYDLAMPDEIDGNKNFAQRFWKGKLDDIIENIINKGYIIYNLLSKDYNSSISKQALNLTVIPDVKYTGSDASEKRGKWLKKNLLNQFNRSHLSPNLPKK